MKHSLTWRMRFFLSLVLRQNGSMFVFGGFDGQTRVNSFFAFSFIGRRWSPVLPAANSGPPPSARDRHIAVAFGNSIYIHGGAFFLLPGIHLVIVHRLEECSSSIPASHGVPSHFVSFFFSPLSRLFDKQALTGQVGYQTFGHLTFLP